MLTLFGSVNYVLQNDVDYLKNRAYANQVKHISKQLKQFGVSFKSGWLSQLGISLPFNS